MTLSFQELGHDDISRRSVLPPVNALLAIPSLGSSVREFVIYSIFMLIFEAIL